MGVCFLSEKRKNPQLLFALPPPEKYCQQEVMGIVSNLIEVFAGKGCVKIIKQFL